MKIITNQLHSNYHIITQMKVFKAYIYPTKCLPPVQIAEVISLGSTHAVIYYFYRHHDDRGNLVVLSSQYTTRGYY